MSEPQHKHFDIKSGRISVGGIDWIISYLLSTNRYVEYLKQLPKLTFNTSYKGLYETLSKIYMACSSGNDIIYAIQQSRELSWNQLEAIKRFDDSEILDVVSFCALFINAPGEDPSKFDYTIHQTKAKALQEEGYSVTDFFSLMVSLIESFSASYLKVQSLSEGHKETDIRLPNTEQT